MMWTRDLLVLARCPTPSVSQCPPVLRSLQTPASCDSDTFFYCDRTVSASVEKWYFAMEGKYI